MSSMDFFSLFSYNTVRSHYNVIVWVLFAINAGLFSIDGLQKLLYALGDKRTQKTQWTV